MSLAQITFQRFRTSCLLYFCLDCHKKGKKKTGIENQD